MRSSADFMVFSSRVVLQQRLADWVARGYINWAAGLVGLERAPRLVKKFNIAYGVNSDRNERARRKRSGLGNAVLVLWRRTTTDPTLFWWLLVTDGDHPAHSAERMRDATSAGGRIVVDGYELVRIVPCETKRNQARYDRPRPSRPTWTWRMDSQKYTDWRESIIQVVRVRTPARQLQDLLRALFSSPGFSGVRHQVGKLAVLYRSEWKRIRGGEDLPPLPARLGYVRRLPNEGVWLSTVLSDARKEVAA